MFNDVDKEKIKEKYEEGKKSYKFDKPLSDNELKEMVKIELDNYKNMSTEEYTLYKKGVEVNRKWGQKTNKNVSVFFDQNPEVPELKYVKNNIGIPDSIDDYKNIEPELVSTRDKTDEKYEYNIIGSILRIFISTMAFNSSIGRSLFYIIRDKITKKYLGVIQISSDFMDLTPRDDYIGGSRDGKTYSGKLNSTAIGGTIVPTQPLGYNYVGGKLLALLCADKRIEQDGKNFYDNKLVGITTTSLYGSFSQYNSLKYWKKLGKSKGSVVFEPSEILTQELYKRLAGEDPYKFYEMKQMNVDFGLIKRNYKSRYILYILSKIGLKNDEVISNFQRGIYFCELFENTKDFLLGNIETTDLKRKFDNNTESLTNLGKEKYAKKRIENLQKNNRENFSLHFYDDLLYMDGKETKEKYLKEVGR